MSTQSVFNHIFLSEQKRTMGQFLCDENALVWKCDDYSIKMDKNTISKCLWSKVGANCQLRIMTSDKGFYRFDGFKKSDRDSIETFIKGYNMTIEDDLISSQGAHWGDLIFEGPEGSESVVFIDENSKRILDFPLSDIDQCALPNRNEVEFQFMEEENIRDNEESVVNIVFNFPAGGPNLTTKAMTFHKEVQERAGISGDKGTLIVELDEYVGTFLTPRGKYSIEMYENHMKLVGKTYTHQIKYKNISSLFLLPLSDGNHSVFVIALIQPIRQGQQSYDYLVLQTSFEDYTIHLSLKEDILKQRYNDKLQPVEQGQLHKIVAKLFKFIAGNKIYVPRDFKSYKGQHFVKCVFRSQSGYLYFLDKCIFYIHKPTIQILFDSIRSVEFPRYTPDVHQGVLSFDLKLNMKDKTIPSKIFNSLDNNEFMPIFDYFIKKGIKIENREKLTAKPQMDLDSSDDSDFDGDMNMESEEDDDFNEQDVEKEEDEEEDEDDMKDLIKENLEDDKKNGIDIDIENNKDKVEDEEVDKDGQPKRVKQEDDEDIEIE
ncbi:hypothetical protein WA158_002722 [Blastocystis sp. Blastoise]